LGRDELARLLAGGQITVSVGAIAALVAMSIGTVYGAISGYYGGWLDTLLMRIVDVFLSIPTLFLLLFLAAMFQGNLLTLMIVIGVTSWLGPARLVRGEVLTLKERLYIEAARSIGAGDRRIIFRHVVPNATGTIITTTTFTIASAMLAETALSYLGIGVRAPTPSWGNLLSSAQSDIFAGAWWLILPPGFAILLTVCAFNFLGDWLRERGERSVVGS
jgi:peptide/nickel transport system permease protein